MTGVAKCLWCKMSGCQNVLICMQWHNVWVAQCLGGQMSWVAKCLFFQKCQNVSATQCLGGKTSLRHNVWVSKCLSVKMLECQSVSSANYLLGILHSMQLYVIGQLDLYNLDVFGCYSRFFYLSSSHISGIFLFILT